MSLAAAQQAEYGNTKPNAANRPKAAHKAPNGTAGLIWRHRPLQALQAATKTNHIAARLADGGQNMEPR